MVVQMIEQLKSFNADRGANGDEMIALVAFGKMMRGEFEARSLAAPEWLDDRLRSLNREIELRRKDTIELRLKEARAQAATLLTAAEKREKLAEEIKALEAQLNPPVPTPTV